MLAVVGMMLLIQTVLPAPSDTHRKNRRVWKGFSIVLGLDFSRCPAQLSVVSCALGEEGSFGVRSWRVARGGGSGQQQEVAQKTLLVASQPHHALPSTPLIVLLEVEFGCIELHICMGS